MTDEDVEKIIKQNMNLQMNLAGIRADFEEAAQRTWVGLTPTEKHELRYSCMTSAEFIDVIEAKLKEKNQ